MMQKQTLSTMLASAIILGSSMVGCSGAGLDHRPALSAKAAPALAPRVEKALAGKDYARALLQAEELVAAVPDDAGYRALLGRAYLANGRYASARAAFRDAMALGNRDVRTIVSLALSETGLGNARAARGLLADHIQDLPAADYGLAMAMAGHPQEGARALLEAVQQPDATAQTRQNLAYALALSGAWAQARLVAGQDLPAREADQRMGQWSQATTEQQRVAALIGISPREDDAGLPARLALAGAAPTQMADADAGDIAAPAEDIAPERLAQADAGSPDTVSVAMAFESGSAANVPMIRASSDPMRAAVRAAFERSKPDAAAALVGRAGMSRIARVIAPAADSEASDWVVQLGAYDSEPVAREKWARISRNRAELGDFGEIHSQFALNGRGFHRLAIRGFGDREAAAALCRSLRAEGQPCFVRLDDTDTTRMARANALKEPRLVARSDRPAEAAGGAGRIAAR